VKGEENILNEIVDVVRLEEAEPVAHGLA